jgi:asparagine synthase (glutamine-hydrolysing)
MACLFGYIGKPAPGLLDRMADRLGHRCKAGWERTSARWGEDRFVEIGHGLAGWNREGHIAERNDPRAIFGYAGVIFNPAEEPLLAGLAGSPENGLTALEGAFTAALALEGDLFLVRDHAGVKALYWTRHKDRLLFASEIKALFADPSVPRRMRIGALPEYLTFSFIPGERTMFEEIFELQPGTLLRFRNGQVETRRHFRFEEVEPDKGTALPVADLVRRVASDLSDSVRECCRVSDRPPGVFLSGGIDSSAVLAHAALQHPGVSLKTFSVHFGPEYANENDFVRMMVDRYRTDHTWLEIRPKRFIRRMREIIWRLDDPIGDPITVPNYLMAEAASEVIDVILNGEGGDPCFGGPKNIPMMLASLYGPLPDEPPDAWLERTYLLTYRKCFTDLRQILTPEVWQAAGGEEALTDILTPFFRHNPPRRFINKLMAINIRLKGANLILVKVDKMTSANGILALPPLFSKRIVETSMMCPPALKLMGNVEKGVLKRAVADILPRPIVDRPKSGMMVPVRFWLQGEMRRYARRMLSKRRLKRMGFFNTDYVRKLLKYDRHEIHGARHGLKLWMLLTFVHWYEQMVEDR